MSRSATRCDAAIIGGGFYGCFIALELHRLGALVTLFEREAELLTRASLINQARVHQGYHYPRNFLTALRSRRNYKAFVDTYSDCVVSDFEHLYAIPKRFTRLSAKQFYEFSTRIGAPIRPAAKQLRELFNPVLVDEVFAVEESAFDATLLRRLLKKELACANIAAFTNSAVTSVRKDKDRFTVSVDGEPAGSFTHVFNCTYAAVNDVNTVAGVEVIPLKHELAEIALVEPPEQLFRVGVTVMDGNFFSCMPYPSTPYHSLTHVRYTPHGVLTDRVSGTERSTLSQPVTHFRKMVQDAARYIPCLAHAQHYKSLFELKTLLPRCETDDGRPILFRESSVASGFFSVMGGKIDNAFDLLPFLGDVVLGRTQTPRETGV